MEVLFQHENIFLLISCYDNAYSFDRWFKFKANKGETIRSGRDHSIGSDPFWEKLYINCVVTVKNVKMDILLAAFV